VVPLHFGHHATGATPTLGLIQKGVYLYLYLLLDEWSRKAIQWRVSWQQTTEESRLLLEGGLVAQNILDLPEKTNGPNSSTTVAAR
jgi:hypothetical protein